jgi:uncharacterized membrane protein
MEIKMKFEKKILMTSILAFAIAGLSEAQAEKEKKIESEKCYGIAKAGQNDCKGEGHNCSGKSEVDGSKSEYLLVPAGLCDKIVGGSLTPDADTKEEKAMSKDEMKESKEMLKNEMKHDNGMNKEEMKTSNGMAKEGQ